jgi:hypothetical protein
MTNEQYARWKDFALRMARTCFSRHRRPNAKWIVDVVEEWFDYFDQDDVPCIVDWDSSTKYPPGNPHHGRQTWTSYCGCDGYRYEYEQPNPDCSECCGTGVHYAPVESALVCDMMTEFLDGYRGYSPWCKACGDSYNRYDNRHGGTCRCDDIEYLYYEQWDDQWGGPVRCCIRAGLDCASAPSAGVIGFTKGDLLEMYPEGVPDWVFPPDEQLGYWLSDELNGTFRELDDSAQLVL